MKVLILTEADCRAVLGMEDAIALQERAFKTLSTGGSVAGLRSFAESETPPGLAIFNACFLKDGEGYGVKIVSDFYENDDVETPRMSATMTLVDGKSGLPHTFMEAGYLTDLRTGAGSGMAAKILAREDSRKLAVIGAGRVALYQVVAITCALDIETVEISTRTRSRGERLVDALRGDLGIEVKLVGTPEQAITDADVVIAATTSATPVISGRFLKPGVLVISAGAAVPDSRELDSETIRRADQCYIDSRDDCLDAAGDYIIASSEGVCSLDDVIDIGDVIAGKAVGRERSEQNFVYKSIGVPIQDLVTGQEIAERARRAGLGVEIEMNP